MDKQNHDAANPRPAPVENRETKRIAQWLRKVHFKRALFGVSEKDVWKKIGELNEMYKTAIVAERVRYDTLLEAQRGEARAGAAPDDRGEQR